MYTQCPQAPLARLFPSWGGSLWEIRLEVIPFGAVPLVAIPLEQPSATFDLHEWSFWKGQVAPKPFCQPTVTFDSSSLRTFVENPCTTNISGSERG